MPSEIYPCHHINMYYLCLVHVTPVGTQNTMTSKVSLVLALASNASILKHSALQSGLLQFLHALLQIILSRSPLSPPLRLLMAFHGWHADSRSKFCLLLLNLVLTYLGHLSRTELCLHIVCFLCACANFSLVLLPSRRHWR